MSYDFCRPKNNPCEKWFLLLLWIFILFRITSGCPKICQCKWRNGKQWVTCTDSKFIDIPRGLEPSTQVLNLEHNNLKILFTDAFVDRSLVNLQKVFLSHCKLMKLEKGSLRRLANLIEIDLSHNYLTSVPSEALDDVSGLRELLMKENKLTELPLDAFRTTPDLVHLDVSFNNITSIHNKAFRSLTRLEVLKISGNRIATIRVEVLKPLVALHGFHVHFNPWHCDCILRPLRQHMLRRNIVTSIPPKCHSPERLKGKQWKILELDEFVCFPEVSAVASRIFAASGENVTLACSFNNESEVTITWHIGDKFLPKLLAMDEQRYKILEMIVSEEDHVRKMSNLTIVKADIDDEGMYRCIGENKAGRVETNVTLLVSEIIIEEPLVAINEMFVAGAVFGALIFVLLAVVLIALIVYRKGRQFDSDRVKLNDPNKIQLPRKSSEEDDKNSASMELIPKQNYEYKSIPTSDLVEDTGLNQNTDNSSKVNEPSINDNILNDLDKPDEDIQVKNITNNIVHDELNDNVSYVEIPKATVNTLNQDQNPLLKNLAQQCRDEILRRKGLKRTRSTFKEKFNTSQYPDLLDFPSEQQRLADTLPRRSSTSTDMASIEILDPLQHRRNPSLPSTPVHPSGFEEFHNFASGTRFLQGEEALQRRQSLTLPPSDAFDLEFHAAQLENFLQEYRNLQEQLFRMKESESDLYYSDPHNDTCESTLDDQFNSFEASVGSYLEEKNRFVPRQRDGNEPLKSILKGQELSPQPSTPSSTLPGKGEISNTLSRGGFYDS